MKSPWDFFFHQKGCIGSDDKHVHWNIKKTDIYVKGQLVTIGEFHIFTTLKTTYEISTTIDVMQSNHWTILCISVREKIFFSKYIEFAFSLDFEILQPISFIANCFRVLGLMQDVSTTDFFIVISNTYNKTMLFMLSMNERARISKDL